MQKKQSAQKRGGDAVQVPLEDMHFVTQATAEEMVQLQQALQRLETRYPRRCQVLECRVFGRYECGGNCRCLRHISRYGETGLAVGQHRHF